MNKAIYTNETLHYDRALHRIKAIYKNETLHNYRALHMNKAIYKYKALHSKRALHRNKAMYKKKIECALVQFQNDSVKNSLQFKNCFCERTAGFSKARATRS